MLRGDNEPRPSLTLYLSPSLFAQLFHGAKYIIRNAQRTAAFATRAVIQGKLELLIDNRTHTMKIDVFYVSSG
jgi:hypothetical protein